MNDFRIEVFLSVARNLSFTKASKELYVSQPAISKHIGELESSYGVALFERANNKIKLTDAGKVFYEYAKDICQKYRELEFEISLLCNENRGKLSIGASTTIAQYVLPVIISKYKQKYPQIELSVISGNTEYVEALVANKDVDLGIVEGATHKREFRYSTLLKDELVLIRSCNGQQFNNDANVFKDEVSISEFKTLPLVLREEGSGTLEVIKKRLKLQNVKIVDLNVIMRLGSSEAIKRYVMAGGSYAIISIAAVVDELRRNELTVVDIEGVDLPREFSFITNSGSQSKIVEDFVVFAGERYNGKL